MSEHYDFHYQPTGSGAISGQQVLQQTEDAINELGDYVNDNVGGAMDVAQQALETAQNAEQDAQTALDTANSFSDAIQSAQQDASTALSTAQTAQTTASNANNTAIQAQQDASSAVTTANNASGQVSTLSGTVTTLGQRVTTAEGNIVQNTSDITALTTRVGTAEGNITTLQNDVSVAMGNASSAMATTGTVKQQAYVFRYSSTALTASSTNSNTLLDNTDNLKVGDKVIDSNGVLFSITAIDTANSTFTIGTALIDLALDANVVHTSEINSSGTGIIEAVKEVGGVNFNTLTTQGFYGTNASGSTNNPESSPCVVQVIKRQNSVIQIANVSSSAYKSRYIRYCADITAQPPVWQSWVKFATDDNVMHLSGNETVAGKKTFSEYITSDGSSTGDEYSNNAKTNLWLMSNRDTEEVSGVLFDTYRQNTAQGTGIHILGIGIKENRVRYEGCRFGWHWDNNLNGYTFDFKPTTQGANQALKHNLGTSDEKWDSINGINPGALSLPDIDNRIDISAYISVTGGQNVLSTYTAPADGWISINLRRASGAVALMISNGSCSVTGRDTTFPDAHRECTAILPVLKNDTVTILSNLADSVLWAYFIPCQGNV